MSKKKAKKNTHNNDDSRPSYARRGEKVRKVIVWAFILMVVAGLILSMTADPTALITPPQAP